jgi:hypothetical protein
VHKVQLVRVARQVLKDQPAQLVHKESPVLQALKDDKEYKEHKALKGQ